MTITSLSWNEAYPAKQGRPR